MAILNESGGGAESLFPPARPVYPVRGRLAPRVASGSAARPRTATRGASRPRTGPLDTPPPLCDLPPPRRRRERMDAGPVPTEPILSRLARGWFALFPGEGVHAPKLLFLSPLTFSLALSLL